MYLVLLMYLDWPLGLWVEKLCDEGETTLENILRGVAERRAGNQACCKVNWAHPFPWKVTSWVHDFCVLVVVHCLRWYLTKREALTATDVTDVLSLCKNQLFIWRNPNWSPNWGWCRTSFTVIKMSSNSCWAITIFGEILAIRETSQQLFESVRWHIGCIHPTDSRGPKSRDAEGMAFIYTQNTRVWHARNIWILLHRPLVVLS